MMETHTVRTAPGAMALVGHIPRLLRGPLSFLESLATCGDLVRVRVGTARTYVVCHPELVHEVLVNDRIFDKGGMLYDAAKNVLGDGLANCSHRVHRRHRRLTQPAFHHARLPRYAAVMNEQITKVMETWRDGQQINVLATMSGIATSVATATLFATEYGHNAAEQSHEDLTILSRGFLRRVLLPDALLALPSPANRRYTYSSARLRAAIGGIITNYRHDGVDHGDLLSMLLTSQDSDGHGLSDTEIHDHVLVFFAAGIDTTAATLAWALHLLAQHPAIQQQLHAETGTVLAGRVATWDDIPRLELTQRVITETLRLYPPGWIFTRMTTADTKLGGIPILAGTSIVISPYLLHRRADIYADPHRFNPDRWLDPQTPTQTRDGYLPFGGGARRCIGATFGMTEATLALASIIAHWRLQPISHHPVRPRLRTTLVPQSVPLRLVAQHHKITRQGR